MDVNFTVINRIIDNWFKDNSFVADTYISDENGVDVDWGEVGEHNDGSSKDSER